MLDIKFIKDNIELVRKNNEERGVSVDLNRLMKLHDERLQLLQETETWRAEKNKRSKAKPTEAVIEKLKKLGQAISGHEAKIHRLSEEIESLLYQIPNIRLSDVPVSRDASGNKELRKWGAPKQFDFTPKDHMELGTLHDIIDTETSAKVSGARFNYLKKEAVYLQLALIRFAFDVLTDEAKLAHIAHQFKLKAPTKTFVPVLVPDMIRPEVYRRMARLNDGDEDKYYFEKDDIYLIGSAEHTTGPMYMDQIIDEQDLPIRLVAYSTSFRREAGAYGKDTKGILRVHQFDKIEIESFSDPQHSLEEQDFIVAIQEYLMQTLELPYRVMLISTGDMGQPDARQIDIETWLPAQNQYRETHTSDLMTDYQARRLNTRVKRANGTNEYVHMNDATVFAIGRTLIAILENNQRADGSIAMPAALQPYLPFKEIARR